MTIFLFYIILSDDEPLTNHASQPNGPDTRSSSAPPHCDQHSEPTRVTDMSRTNGWTGTHDVSEGGREPGNIVLQDTLNTAPKGGVGQLLVNGKSKESDADRNKEVTLCDGLSWSEGALADRPPLLGKRSRGEESPALAALLTTPTQEVDSNCKMRKVEGNGAAIIMLFHNVIGLFRTLWTAHYYHLLLSLYSRIG